MLKKLCVSKQRAENVKCGMPADESNISPERGLAPLSEVAIADPFARCFSADSSVTTTDGSGSGREDCQMQNAIVNIV